MIFPFIKYQGTGNDFLIIDDSEEIFPLNDPSIVKKICHRNLGVGADGILLLRHSSIADYKMIVMNADGSLPSMCGNGLRCFIKYIADQMTLKREYTIETGAGVYKGSVKGDTVALEMNIAPHIESRGVDVKEVFFEGKLLNTGVPHFVSFVSEEQFSSLSVKEVGGEIRRHSQFTPEGVNVNFVSVQSANLIKVRTYERGVEDETLACGTGCVAATLVASDLHSLNSPVRVIPRSGQELTVGFEKKDGSFTSVTLEGEARRVFRGEIDL